MSALLFSSSSSFFWREVPTLILTDECFAFLLLLLPFFKDKFQHWSWQVYYSHLLIYFVIYFLTTCRNALGPSSGTVCLSGLLICAVHVVRAAVDSARQEELQGIVNLMLRCCVNALLTAIDFLNKFTINFAAITGEAYCTSARMTYELLKRNLLSAVFVETVSSRILGGIVFVFSAIYAIVVSSSFPA